MREVANGRRRLLRQEQARGEIEAYAQRREALYGPLRNEGRFTWDRMYGEEYALAEVVKLSETELSDLRRAVEALGRVYARTIEIVQQGGEELWTGLGLPGASFGALGLRLPLPWVTLIGRFDMALTPDGWKMLEFNSDTPTGIVEAFHVNGRICAALGLRDPNEGCSARLRGAFAGLLATYREAGYAAGRIVFSALDWHEEDAGTTRYLLEQAGLPGAVFAPLSALRIYGERMYAAQPGPAGQGGRLLGPIDVLYRLHALEKLAEDRDEDGYPTGEQALRLIAARELAIINPPSAFAAQTKALQALIWNLHEAGEFYTAEEHAAIAAHMLPTYMEPRFHANGAYVSKPVLGREGSDVTIYRANGDVAASSAETDYAGQPMVYQQYAELPTVQLQTLKGAFSGRLLWGCFLIAGEASAVIARAGGSITDNMSYYVPSTIG